MVEYITSDFLEEARRARRSRCVRVINDKITIKLGAGVLKGEFENMKLVHGTHTLPCPEPLEFIEMEHNINAIVMSTIHGRHPHDRDIHSAEYGKQIADGFIALNQCLSLEKSKNTKMVSPDKGGCMLFPFAGQFLDYSVHPTDFVETMEDENIQLPELKYLQQTINTALLGDGELYFHHMDLHQGNIFVKDGVVTGIIDWEYAGWYTHAMEYMAVFMRLFPRGDPWANRFNPTPPYLLALGDHLNVGDHVQHLAFEYQSQLYEGYEEQYKRLPKNKLIDNGDNPEGSETSEPNLDSQDESNFKQDEKKQVKCSCLLDTCLQFAFTTDVVFA